MCPSTTFCIATCNYLVTLVKITTNKPKQTIFNLEVSQPPIDCQDRELLSRYNAHHLTKEDMTCILTYTYCGRGDCAVVPHRVYEHSVGADAHHERRGATNR